MRFAVQSPEAIFRKHERDFTGYAWEFIRNFKPVLFFPSLRHMVTGGKGLRKLVARKTGILDFDFAFSARELNAKADALLCFNDFPYLPANRPPRALHLAFRSPDASTGSSPIVVSGASSISQLPSPRSSGRGRQPSWFGPSAAILPSSQQPCCVAPHPPASGLLAAATWPTWG